MNAPAKSDVRMIAPPPFFADRGCHVRVLNSYRRFEHDGSAVRLITYPLGRDIHGVRTIRPVRLPGYRKTSPGFSWYRPLLDALMVVIALREVLRKRPALVYAHLHEGAAVALLLKGVFGLGFVFDAQGSLVGELTAHGSLKPRGAAARILKKVESVLIQQAEQIVTSTEALKWRFVEASGRASGAFTVVNDELNHTHFDPSVEPANLALPDRRRATVAYLGGMQRYKGMDALVDCIRLTPPDIHFLVMGYPVEYFERRVAALNLQDRVTITGPVRYEEAPRYLKLADVAISPKSLESGEANAKIFNYLKMRLPVVCFDSEETRRIVGSRGYYANPGDATDLANKVILAVEVASGGTATPET